MVEKDLITSVKCGQTFQALWTRILAYDGEGFVY